MKLKLVRAGFTDESTIGCLYIDGAFECFTLEDKVREVKGQPVEAWKIKGKTAIPRGTYPVSITPSNRFKRDLPLVANVPGFEGIRIHPGNTSADTEGCILVGQGKAANSITSSVKAFEPLFAKLQAAVKRGELISLEVS
jgi:Family of unknown function (DUF5675)